MNKLYRIRLVFSCPYIGQRNGGNRVVNYGLTLDEALEALRELFNLKMDLPYAATWEEAVSSTITSQMSDGAYRFDENAFLDYDSRRYIIEEDTEE